LCNHDHEQVEWEYSRQLALRRLEQEQGSREAAEELSVSEGETTKADAAQQQQPLSSVARVGSEARIVSDDEDDDGKDDRNLYIVLIRYINTHVIRSCPAVRLRPREGSLAA
jgi:sucrose-phosphate synthase